MIVPHVLGDVAAADDGAGAAYEEFEQRVLLRGEGDFASAHPRAAAAGVQRQAARGHPFFRQRLRAAADQRAQPCQQFAEIVRLDEVIVRAAVEARDARIDRVARGEHQNRHGRPRRANGAAHGQSAFDRKHHVQNDRVVVVGRRLEERRLAVRGDVHGVRLLAQPLGQHSRGVRFVFHQQQAHETIVHRDAPPCHGTCRRSRFEHRSGGQSC